VETNGKPMGNRWKPMKLGETNGKPMYKTMDADKN